MSTSAETPGTIGPELRGELRDELVRALGLISELAGRDLSLAALSGGITNRNFLVTFVAYVGEHFDRLLASATTPAFERALREAAEA